MRAMFACAIQAADPDQFMPEAIRKLLPDHMAGRLFITGFGKASAVMARSAEANLPAALRPHYSGEVIVPDGHEEACEVITITSASHPVPDARGHAAAARILAEARSLSEGDLMLVLVSGGGSSLLCLPHGAVTLDEKQQITSRLLAGAPIDEMNCVRKHLSIVKGGILPLPPFRPARWLWRYLMCRGMTRL